MTEHDDAADTSWGNETEIVEVTEVNLTGIEGREVVEFTLKPGYVAQSAGTFQASWTSDGLLQID
jgi:hypothetical protein